MIVKNLKRFSRISEQIRELYTWQMTTYFDICFFHCTQGMIALILETIDHCSQWKSMRALAHLIGEESASKWNDMISYLYLLLGKPRADMSFHIILYTLEPC